MRPLALLTVLLASLAVAAPATAKEIQSVTVCGVDGCTSSTNAELIRGMIDVGPPTGAPQAPAPFYRLTMAVGDDEKVFDRFQMSWLPSTGRMLAQDGSWLAVRPEVRRDLDRLTAGVEALPASQLPAIDADVAPPRSAPPVTPDGGVPVVPLVAVVLLLAAVWLLVRRHATGSGSAALPQRRSIS